jgi:hypothetical protein
MCIDLITKNIIKYCNTYYGSHSGGLKCMFVDLTYLQLDDGASDDENYNQDLVDEVNIIDIGGLTTMDEDNCFDNVDVPEGSSTPMDQALVCLHETMVEITTGCTMGASVKLRDHVTSLFRIIGSNIHHLHLARVNDPCTQEWYFVRWMMGLGTPLTG